MIGIVPQQATLFGGTIRENMQWGNPHATDEEIYEALELSQSKEFIDKMTEGLDTYIEQGCKNVSGGQRQRLAICQVVLGGKKLLIFDEPTSGLDFRHMCQVEKMMKRLAEE